MPRYIDADWLLDVVENIIEWDTERDRNRIIHQVRELTPSVDVVSRELFEQIKWERDMAIQQLESAGMRFCGERRTDGMDH